MLKIQRELFPLLLSEGNSGGNEAREPRTRFSGGSLCRARGHLHFCAWTTMTSQPPQLLFCLLFFSGDTKGVCVCVGGNVLPKAGMIYGWPAAFKIATGVKIIAPETPHSLHLPLPKHTSHQAVWDVSKRASNVESFRKAFLMKDRDLCPFYKACDSCA